MAHTALLAAVLAVLGTLCLVAVPWGRSTPTSDLELVDMRRLIRLAPGQELVGGTETYPYWERENTGDPEAFADVSCCRDLAASLLLCALPVHTRHAPGRLGLTLCVSPLLPAGLH